MSVPSETYKARLRQYQRREQMLIWTAAGIAALPAFIVAGALAASPPLLKKLIFTVSIIGGGAFAFSRVGFEWEATKLKRAIDDCPVVQNAVLADEDKEWPSTPERMWTVTLVSMGLGWCLMLFGIWLPPASIQPNAASEVRLSLDLTGAGLDIDCLGEYKIGPLEDGAPDRVEEGNESFENQTARVARDLEGKRQKRRLVALLFVGSADKRPLRAALTQKFGSNAGLAQVRAKTVRERLEAQLKAAPPNALVLSTGPSLAIMKQNGNEAHFREALASDRHVQVCAVWGT